MTSDDRDDIEPHSPSSFKVGEADRLSGFFTPVWESKRRLRAESPIPASSAAASAPSSARGADSDAVVDSAVAAERPSAAPTAPAPRGPFVAATPPRAPRPALGKQPSASPTAPRLTPAAAVPAGGSSAKPMAAASAAKKAAASTPSLSPERPAKAPSEPAATLGRKPERPSRVPQPANAAAAPSVAPESEPGSARDGSGQAGVTVRPVIPMPQNPGRTTPRGKAPSVPPAAGASTPQRAPAIEPSLPREPELRAAPPTSAPPARASWPGTEQRSALAAGVAAVLHDKLRGKAVDSVDTLARHRETESEREALQRAAARAAATPPDPYPSHLLRTLRRTLHLSMTLPESVRAMIEKYRY